MTIPGRFEVLQMGPYPPPNGGVQTNLVAIRNYLRAKGIRCMVINLTLLRQLNHDDVFFTHGAKDTIRLLLSLPHAIVHMHIGGDLTTRLLALSLLCCWLPRTRTVFTFHSGGYPTSPAGESARPWTFRGFVLRRFDRVIGVNAALVNMFVERFGVARERVRLILPHGLPASPPPVPFPPAIEEFFAAHTHVLLSMGWLQEEYDFPLQIRALGPVRQKFPGAGLLILGEGILERQLRDQIAATAYAEHVLLPGDVPRGLSLAITNRAGILLRTTLYDGDSISVREALHFGTPVIASDNGMRPPGVSLTPIGDLEKLVEASRPVGQVTDLSG
jgi:glycosyltransferase involved in cell wall biosynthesis